MRLIAIVTAIVLCAFGLASAQTPIPVQHPYGLDPYKPSDAELLRKYGSVLATQTPLLELHKLDPYKPSQAALLRALGGAIPLWAISYPLAPAPAFLTPFPPTAAMSPRGNDGRPRSNRRLRSETVACHGTNTVRQHTAWPLRETQPSRTPRAVPYTD